MLLDQFLINLKVVSKLETNEKITINNDSNITILKTGVLQTVTRYVKGDTRDLSIDIINQIIYNIFELSNNIIEFYEMKIELLGYKREKKIPKKLIEKYSNLILIKQELENSLNGINNLFNTYAHDPRTSSRIDYIKETINSYINKLDEKIILFNDYQKKYNDILSDE